MEKQEEKYTYYEGDIEFGDSQCSLCKYFEIEKQQCSKIGKISKEILSDNETCELFDYDEND